MGNLSSTDNNAAASVRGRPADVTKGIRV